MHDSAGNRVGPPSPPQAAPRSTGRTTFDGFFLTVDPNGRVQARRDVLEEEDGPMLLHGLQELHGRPMILPRREAWRPDSDLLALRLEKFAAR